MSIFPMKILVGVDDSREVTLTAQTAVKIADETGSELHMVYVRSRRELPHPGDYEGPEVAEHWLQREEELLAWEAQKVLDTQVKEIEAAGSSVAQTHLRVGKPDEEIVALGEELEPGLITWLNSSREPETGRGTTRHQGERLRFRRSSRSLPGLGGAQRETDERVDELACSVPTHLYSVEFRERLSEKSR